MKELEKEINQKRRPDSVRFVPYFRIQEFTPRTCAWMDVKGKCDTIEEARAVIAKRKGKKCRVREISMAGSRILE